MADNTLFDNAALTTQRSINATSGTLTFTNSATDNSFSIDPTDLNDYYKLTVSRSSGVVIKLTPQGGDLSLSLLNASGNDNDTVVNGTNNPGGLAEAIVTDSIAPLEPGQTYYIRVSGNNPTSAINYTLTVETNPSSRADLLWRDYGTTGGSNAIWRMDGTTLVSGQATGPSVTTNWVLQAAGDFDGDGFADYIWHEQTTGTLGMWLMDGTGNSIKSTISLPSVSSEWYIGGVGDFNGDSKLDIVWRYAPTGLTGIWLMDRTTYSTAVTLDHLSGSDWVIETVADFDQDGKADVFYRNLTTGENTFWLMNGTQFKSSESLTTVSGNWRMEGAGDFDGDGDLDLVWREYTQGLNGVWFMENTAFVSATALPSVTSNWAIAGVLTNSLPTDLAGNSTGAAFNIGLLDNTATYSDTIGPSDLDDYYSFSLDVTSKIGVTANGTGFSTASTIQVLSSTGVVLATSAANGNDEAGLTNLLLDPGTYFVKLSTTSTQDIFYNVSIAAEEQVLPVNLFFPPVTPPETVTTFRNVNGQVFDSNTPVSVNAPFTFDLDYKVTYGDRALDSFKVGFYLSKDGVLDTATDYRFDLNNDGLINENDVAVITNTTPGSIINQTQRLILPSKDSPFWLDDGLYNIIIVLDPNNEITETNPQSGQPAEDDNTFAAAIRVRDARLPDLTGSVNVIETNAQKGTQVTLSGIIRNIGQGVSDAQNPPGSQFEVSFYLSRDNTLSTDDFALDPFLEFGPLDPGGQTSFPLPNEAVTALLPTTWVGYNSPPANNTYFLLMVIDEFGTVNEVTNGTENNVVFDTVVIV